MLSVYRHAVIAQGTNMRDDRVLHRFCRDQGNIARGGVVTLIRLIETGRIL